MEIVFIDDQEDVREIMTMILEDELDANVISFPTSVSAYEYLSKKNSEISLIICDYKLPKETGMEFYEKIKSKAIPFILMTGMCFEDDNEVINSFLSGEKNKILYKPIDEEQLIKEIKLIA